MPLLLIKTIMLISHSVMIMAMIILMVKMTMMMDDEKAALWLLPRGGGRSQKTLNTQTQYHILFMHLYAG